MINFENNKEKIIYTIKHRYAFLKCVENLCPNEYKQEMLLRAKYHDMDKVILNCLCDSSLSSKIHNNFSLHHKTDNKQLSKYDYIEMIIDWECARYTKPDKPRNSCLTLYTFYNDLQEQILPLLKELDLLGIENKDNQNVIKEVNDFVVSDKIIEEQIKDYILDYENSIDKYEVVKIAINVLKKRFKENH